MKIYIYLFLVFSILLFLTSPSLNSGDSGEFITSSFVLGITHSPGYPLYCLIGKIAFFIIPFGNYAYRINILNILITLLNILIIYKFIFKFYDKKIKFYISILFLNTLIFSEYYLKNSIQTEVFILNSFFCIFIIIILLNFKYNLFYLLFYVFGLSLGNHQTIIFLFPGIILYLLIKQKINFKTIIISIFFFFLGLSIYLYLPIRSRKNPYFDWGDTERISNFFRVILRKDYGTFQLTIDKPLERNFKNFYLQINRFFVKSKKNLGIFVFILFFLSFYILYINNKKFTIFLIISYLFSGLGFFILANLPFEYLHDGILERFYILPNTIGIIGIMVSLIYIKKHFLILLAISFLSFFNNLYKNVLKCNYREYFLNYDYGKNILKSLPYNSILFIDGGDDTFYTLGYFQAVEKRRKDLSIHDRGGLVFKNIYGKDFRSLSREKKEERRLFIEKSFINLRPVFYSTFNEKILPGETLQYAGLLYLVKNSLSNYNSDIFFDIYSYRSIYKKYYDYRSEALAPIYYFMEARQQKNLYKKYKYFKYIYFLYPQIDWLKNNVILELHEIGYKSFLNKNLTLSLEVYKLINQISSNDIYALLNLGVIYENLGHFNIAEEHYKKVIELDSYNQQAYYNLGSLYWKLARWSDSLYMFQKVLDLNPQNHEIKKYIEYLKSKI